MPDSPGGKRALARLAWVGAAIRDAWLMLGIAILLWGALEVAYRGQALVRRAFGGSQGWSPPQAAMSLHPYADSAWWPEFLRERDALHGRWEPYAYSRLDPRPGPYIQVGNSGLRLTPQPEADGAAPPLRVFFFGGSTTFGFADRDEATRPALVAEQLAEAGYGPEVTNFGQPGYVAAQELVTLLFELRAGNVPDLVVFWDGLNDMNALRDHGKPGLTFREIQRATGFEMMADMASRGGAVRPGLALHSLMHFSQLYERIRAIRVTDPELPPLADPDVFCDSMLDYWTGVVQVVERLGEAYGFRVLMIWQPTWQSSGRPQSAYERAIEGTTILEQHMGMTAHVERCAELADSITRSGRFPSMRNWAWMHRGDTATVYTDEGGHETERITRIEADALTAEILEMIASEPMGATH